MDRKRSRRATASRRYLERFQSELSLMSGVRESGGGPRRRRVRSSETSTHPASWSRRSTAAGCRSATTTRRLTCRSSIRETACASARRRSRRGASRSVARESSSTVSPLFDALEGDRKAAIIRDIVKLAKHDFDCIGYEVLEDLGPRFEICCTCLQRTTDLEQDRDREQQVWPVLSMIACCLLISWCPATLTASQHHSLYISATCHALLGGASWVEDGPHQDASMLGGLGVN